MTEPFGLSDKEVVVINARALTLFGGLEGGVRDQTHAVAAIFLELNGWVHVTDEADVVRTMIGVAEGSIKEAALAAWFRKTSTKA